MTAQARARATTRKAVVKPRAKTAAASQVVRPPLDEGDLIEFSVTAEVKNRQGRSFWVKGGAAGRIRPGETASAAKDRISGFVIGYVDDGINEYLK